MTNDLYIWRDGSAGLYLGYVRRFWS